MPRRRFACPDRAAAAACTAAWARGVSVALSIALWLWRVQAEDRPEPPDVAADLGTPIDLVRPPRLWGDAIAGLRAARDSLRALGGRRLGRGRRRLRSGVPSARR